MVRKKYIPKQGDIVSLSFSPQKGHEQSGKRPALIVSNNVFNKKTGFALACPITRKDNKFPLHLLLPEDISTVGFVLTEHVRSIDFKARKVSFVEKASNDFVDYTLDVLKSFYE